MLNANLVRLGGALTALLVACSGSGGGGSASGGAPGSSGAGTSSGGVGVSGSTSNGGAPGASGGAASAGQATQGGSPAGGMSATGGTAGNTSGGAPTSSGGVPTSSGGVPTSSGGVNGGMGTTSGGMGTTSGGMGTTSGGMGTTSGGMSAAGGSAGKGGTTSGGAAGSAGQASIVETVELGDVWSGQPVNFALVTRDNQQFAAFYDAERNMTVASRTLGSSTWTRQKLASVLGWDSHNHVALAIDETGQIHVSGNMHGVPLIYFRTTRALDVTSFAKVASMVGTNEAACTYPEFFKGPAGNLVFMYRDGASGNGNHIFNAYNATSKTWSRLLGSALTNGEGARNAYPVGPIQGPDGNWHLVWVWRETADAATNHDLSYARTQDLVNWQSGGGRALTLPITLGSSDIVDPVPQNGGMINNNTKVGFDAQKRPIVGYHKNDASGYTQIYNARLENGRWVVYRATDFTYKWAFGGTGTLVFEIELDGVRSLADGSLVQDFYHAKHGGKGTLRLNPTTLHADVVSPPLLPYPANLDMPQSTTAGMVVRWAKDAGQSPDSTVRYMLRWETLESNRDMPRDPIPPATKLRLYGFRVAN